MTLNDGCVPSASVCCSARSVIELHRALADSTEVPEIRELFDSLIRMEDGKDRQYSKAVLEFLGEN